MRDCGASDKLNLALRDAIAKGWVVGPRIYAAGSVSTTGGHGDGTNGMNSRLQELLDPTQIQIANGPDEIRRVVRQRYKDGADFIKIAATGGVPGDPLADIKLMTQVSFVMKAGTVYKP